MSALPSVKVVVGELLGCWDRVVGAEQQLGLERRQHCQPVSEGNTSEKSTQGSLSPFLHLGKLFYSKVANNTLADGPPIPI